ncbi:PqiA/YebS family transporter subunit [Orbus sturtevantii]|uniref:PqiA/YebS family transporter subunit n=1 Tax=Orbus sturtevantii TaxID=3074109 RepID=UPI00370D946E
MQQSDHASHQHYALCHQCDIMCELPPIEQAHQAVCPRCHTKLARELTNMRRDTVIYSSCALIMLLLSASFVFIHIKVIGIIDNLRLLSIPTILYEYQYPSLMVLFLLFTLILPICVLIIQLILCSPIRLSKYHKRNLLIAYGKLEHWCMPEIFMAGVLVSFVKLTSYGEIGVDKAFWSFALFIFFYLKSSIDFSPRKFWNEIASNNFIKTNLLSGKTGMSQNIRLCLHCHAMLPAELTHCPRCKCKGTLRQKNSIQWTIALLMTSLMFYLPANIYGIMNTVFLSAESSSTILDGVIYMWQEGDYPVALVIFSASVTIPILKILALSWLCYFVLVTRKKNKDDCLQMNRLYNIVEFIGRWSMIDIFVVSVISALIRNKEMMSVYPDIGAIFFASVVVITMIASQKYDPRLIWDKN